MKYAKWVSWLGGIAASVGSAVSLQVELYHTFHALNKTDADIMTRIENVTSQLEQLQDQSEQEFQEYPDQTIFDLYHRPLRRDERGIYRLGFEDIPRSEENPTEMDSIYQDIPGFPPEIEEVERAMRTTTSTTTTTITTTQMSHLEKGLTLQLPQRRINQVSHLEKGFTLADATPNATRSPTAHTSPTDPTLAWYDVWERMSPKLIGWIILAMAGLITLLAYAAFVLCVRKCCVFISSRISRSTRPQEAEVYPRAIPPERIEIANFLLDELNNVNLYEVVPVTQPIAAGPPVPAVPLSAVRDK